MKVYVAGASSEIYRAEHMLDKIRQAGHEITVDWPALMRASGLSNTDFDAAARRYCADQDARGVAEADLVVLLVPRHPNATQGAWWEGGIANGLGIPTIAAGRPDDRARNIFLAHTHEVDSDEDVLELLAHPEMFHPPTAHAEVLALRAEVRALRAGIRKLMETLRTPRA